MTDNISPSSFDDVLAQAISHLEQALELLDQLGLRTPAARLDFVLAEVRDADQGDTAH